jgi:hypothetical protein
MAEKTEYRLDEYREYKNGKWGPWRKLDGRLFDGGIPAIGSEEYGIYREWRFGKIENKDAGGKLEKIRGFHYEWVNSDDLHKPERKDSLKHLETAIEKIEGYLKEIEDKIIQEQGEAEAKKQQPQAEADKAEEHYFMRLCKEKYPETYRAMKAGLKKECIVLKEGKFNFLLPVGKVSYFFAQTGCTQYKEIANYILIRGRGASINSLRNSQNYKTELWIELKKTLEL